MTRYRRVGILGGMGPAATADFYAKIIAATPAVRDQDHLPVLIWSDPRIPCHTPFLLGQGPDPYPLMLEGAQKLRDMGADFLAIPCNTAHHCHAKLAAALSPWLVLHIVDTAIDDIVNKGVHDGKIGLLASEGTRKAKLYETKLLARGFQPVLLDEAGQKNVTAAIHDVKAGDHAKARNHLLPELQTLLDRGCSKVILGCTEIPVALDADTIKAHCIDATEALAHAVLRAAVIQE